MIGSNRHPRAGQDAPAATLFLCMFAAQAAFLVLAPILPEIGREFGVSTATAGQLRLVSAAAGGAVALILAPLARRVDLRDLLTLGLALLGAGSVASAIAPSFAVLALAQLAVGAGVGILLSGTIAAATEWAGAQRRARLLSWALLGQPAAWVAGLPAVGAIAGIDWRLALLAVPFLASLGALITVRQRPAGKPTAALAASWTEVWRTPAVAGWALGELFAFAAWGGTLVFAGALFIESYGASAATVGLALGAGATAYFPGNFLVRRHLDRAAHALVVALALALAAGVAVFGIVRPGLAFSSALFAALVFLAGGRTLAGSAVGLDTSPGNGIAVTSLRAAATQFGYLLGVAAAGTALAMGGYAAFGATQAGLFLAAALAPATISLSRTLRSVRARTLAFGFARTR